MTGQTPAGQPVYGATITPCSVGYTITLNAQHGGPTGPRFEYVGAHWRLTRRGARRLAERLIRRARAVEDREQAKIELREPL